MAEGTCWRAELSPWPPLGQRSPGFGWKQLWDEELAGPDVRFEARKVKGTDAFRI